MREADIYHAIIDTNVVFEGLTKKAGASGLIIDAWIAGLFKAYISNALSYEYEDVLFRKLSEVRWQRIKPVLGILLDKSEFVTIHYTWRPSSPDPGDEHLIDCAMNSGVPIVTFNTRDFRTAKISLGLIVMTPDDFVNYLAG
ncbi:MAG TPA: toxin-antitoxin system toxin component, PIN family protein [Desulfobacteraceae bacterium]|nr:toxin-antitoxin system toxin component, PIN family protein [Desulfobacteraceae bacterium]